MISFECDYNNGAHPKVLEALVKTNGEITDTYGFDRYSLSAKEKIRMACEAPEADIFFLGGGTQTNATVIDGMLRSFEAVVTVETGHIAVHEAGAVEHSGHKVITLPSHDGRLDATELDNWMQVFDADESRDHVPQPGMVYISLPTELGTLYTSQEIDAIYRICEKWQLKLFIDGARLGYGIAASEGDITLPWLARHCDAFYIGGTKVGALCGEALVFPRNNAPKAFFSIVKRHGALMAKGRVIGLQFDALFTDNLYFNIARHAIDMAMQLKAMFTAKGYPLFIDSPTNQQFFILTPEQLSRLKRDVVFSVWQPLPDGCTAVRFVTSWATTAQQLEALERLL